MVLTGDEAIVYLYTLRDKNKKFEESKEPKEKKSNRIKR